PRAPQWKLCRGQPPSGLVTFRRNSSSLGRSTRIIRGVARLRRRTEFIPFCPATERNEFRSTLAVRISERKRAMKQSNPRVGLGLLALLALGLSGAVPSARAQDPRYPIGVLGKFTAQGLLVQVVQTGSE